MPKFLVHARYTAEGTKGLLKSGGTSRRKAVEDLLSALGGKLEQFYFAIGKDDAILVVDLPSIEAALAVAMSVRASGATETKTTPLVTLEEVDRAAKLHAEYRPPGA